MKLLVLAGGFGTRMQSVVSQVPKALAPIGDVPFLHLQIDNWISQGVTSLVFLLHHQSEQIIEYVKSKPNGVWRNLDMQWVIEESPLGTGGAIANAVTELQIHGEFLLTNADTWLGSGLVQMAGTGTPTIGVIEVSNPGRYGIVAFNAQNKVTNFMEKDEFAHGNWINAGVANLSADFFRGGIVQTASLERDYFPRWVEQGILKATHLYGEFIDIGVPEDYFRFCHWIASGKSETL
jgi:D-glycero-alpha-D-manno-heptose 1-phosphate guanylyltransferase